MRRSVAIVAVAVFGVGATLAIGVAPASAVVSAPQWTVTSVSVPTVFKSGEEVYRVTVTNTGGASSDGEPVRVVDELPVGLSPAAKSASGLDDLTLVTAKGPPGAKISCVLDSCAYDGVVVPDDTLIFTFPVEVDAGAPPSINNVVRVSGGGALDVSMSTPTRISTGEQAGFGIAPGGAATALSTSQAGAHPDITTSIAFASVNEKGSLAEEPKDLITEEPPGFAGDLVDTPTCTPAQFAQIDCPVDAQIGVTTLSLLELTSRSPRWQSYPVYNIAPNPGEVAKFGFTVINNFGIQGNVSVRPGDYGLRVSFHNTDQSAAQLEFVSLTVWGVPADPIHDPWRFKHEGTPPQGSFGQSSEASPAAYFTNPTSCGSEPLEAAFEVTSWEHPQPSESPPPTRMPFGPIVGCDRLSMPTTFAAEPTTDRASAATGLSVGLNVAQTYDNAYALATSTLNKAVVTLPEGMTVNPSAGAGLGACSEAEYEEEELEPSAAKGCPSDSKLGTVGVETPVLKERGTGSVFVAQPYANPFHSIEHPFGSLIALYVVIRFPERGVIAKLAGEVSLDATTGQLVTTFEGTPFVHGPSQPGLPPVPFSSFQFKFIQGPTAPLVTPPVCGDGYRVTAALTPWSEPNATLQDVAPAFAIVQGFEEGSPCPSGATPPFHPQVVAGTQNNAAGSYSPFYLRIVREDGEQEITRFSTIMPPGLTGNLSGIPFCPDSAIQAAREQSGAQAEASPACPAASQVGRSIVGAGVGPVLAQTPGRLYLAGPYHGAPLSLVSVTSAKVGPFDLGTVVIRFGLRINPITAQVEVDASTSDAIPHIIKGVVVHVRDIRAYVDRPGFIMNPTSCERLSIGNVVTGAGADPANPADQVPVPTSSPFQAANCASLNFKPSFKVTTNGRTSKADGASLSVNLAMPGALGTNANIHQVKVELPVQLPSRLTTLQKACTKAQFDANPAGCPAASVVGHARAVTPIVPVPLEGPAYFVSNGAEAFPNLIIVLQGYGITIDLVGDTFISKQGITSSTFKAVPDQPVTSFELTLPQGPFSALTANTELCALTKTVTVKKKVTLRAKNGRRRTVTRRVKQTVATSLSMPTEFVAQNGMVLRQTTPIAVTGCPRAVKKTAAKAKKRARRHGRRRA